MKRVKSASSLWGGLFAFVWMSLLVTVFPVSCSNNQEMLPTKSSQALKKPTRKQPTSKPTSRPTKRAIAKAYKKKKYKKKKQKKWTLDFLKNLSAPPPQVEKIPAKVLIYTGGLKSYFEPCGCQSDMLGGLNRLASLLKGYESLGLKLFPIDAGNTFFEGWKIEASKKIQSTAKSKLVADLYKLLGVRFMGIGPYDLTLGVEALRKLLKRTGAQALAANLIDARTQKLLFTPSATFTFEGIRIGLFGLTSPLTFPKTPPKEKKKKGEKFAKLWEKYHIRTTSHKEAALQQIAALKKKKVDIIVLLSTLGEAKTSILMQEVQGIDIAIEGATGVELNPPRRIGDSFLLSPPKEGSKVGILSLYRRNGKTKWVGIETPKERAKALKKMGKQVTAYQRQANQIRKQGPDFAPIAAVYDTQAKQLQSKIVEKKKILSAPPSLPPGDNGYLHLLQKLSKKVPQYPKANARISLYQKELKAANLAALMKVKPILKTATGDFYVGVARCKPCHEDQYKFWKTMKHANAYHTLAVRDKQFDLDCIGCHVVAWHKPGGLYNIKNPKRLADVQCENCHGPGGIHATVIPEKKHTRLKVPASVCQECHQGSHDPNFNYLEKVKKILGKGHGEARLKELIRLEKEKKSKQ